ncbi:ABC transporter ATP-binding protein [Fodinicola acaciae]|uniref:ABC transporter ATP-binding protein n=1 Tax=Fodinicola acaciae TaxID=2681555 RepID=UPI001C9E97BA|nr:ABC transporter ATP-binding protein [Fodinicola acaciae]
MRTFPHADAGRPPLSSPAVFLLWMWRKQAAISAGGMTWGVLWMASAAAMPLALGKAIDTGLAAHDPAALAFWVGLLAVSGVIQTATGTMRHRFAVSSWLSAAYRVEQLVVEHAARLGAVLPRRISTGEVVAVTASDMEHIGDAYEVSNRTAGAVLVFAGVAALMIVTTPVLGIVVVVGTPILMLIVGPMMRPLERRQAEQRKLFGETTTIASDTVTGLRILRGIGGEDLVVRNYKTASQKVRQAGVRVARVASMMEAAQILLPGLFAIMIAWLGARLALDRQISAGQLVSAYAYAAFLVLPLRTFAEMAEVLTKAVVAAKRIIAVLRLDRDIVSPADPLPMPDPATATLADALSGAEFKPGLRTAVVCERRADADALAERLARYVDADVRFGGVPLAELELAAVRAAILLADPHPHMFSGPLAEELDPTGQASRAAIEAAVGVADAEDVVEALPDGLDTEVIEQGRFFSGGQRQRLVLARSLVADPDVLILLEPTSAVDAHTESRIAGRLTAARAGRTTIVFSTSPLLAGAADEVVFLPDGGKTSATGNHHALLRQNSAYRAVVTRGTS